MKTKILFLITCLVILASPLKIVTAGLAFDSNATLYSSQELVPLAKTLTSSFLNVHPDMDIELVTIPSGLKEKLNNSETLALITQNDLQLVNNSELWNILVAREVVIPLVNSGNPLIDLIKTKGITPSALSDMIKPGTLNWGGLLQSELDQPVDLFLTSDKTVKQVISDFAGLKPDNLNISEFETNDFFNAIKNNPYAIGFCKADDLSQIDLKENEGFISLLPFDKNENGKLDYFENIYEDSEKLHRGVWMGKYPKNLIRNYYITGAGITENTVVKEFANWVLTKGQPLISDYGLNELAAYERSTNLEKLSQPEIIIEPEKNTTATYKIIMVVFIIFLSVGLITAIFNLFMKRKQKGSSREKSPHPGVLEDRNVILPGGLYFDKTYTWAYMEKDGLVRVGLNEFLPRITGELTRIATRESGESVKKNEAFLTLIKNGKQIKIYSPVSGTIQAYNEDLLDDPSLVSFSPYNNGWIYLIKPSNWIRETSFYKLAHSYREWLKTELTRLKDFLAETTNSGQAVPLKVTLQEGGNLPDNVMENMSPQTWEDFQKNFIDSAIL